MWTLNSNIKGIPKIQYHTIIPHNQSCKQVHHSQENSRIVDEHLMKNTSNFLKYNVKGDSTERSIRKWLHASGVQCSVNMESEKWTHILNFITVQLKGDFTGILASRSYHIQQKLKNHLRLLRIGYALPFWLQRSQDNIHPDYRIKIRSFQVSFKLKNAHT
jgi:hypothetical protein